MMTEMLGEVITTSMILQSITDEAAWPKGNARGISRLANKHNVPTHKIGRTLFVSKEILTIDPLAKSIEHTPSLLWPEELASLAMTSLHTAQAVAGKLGVSKQTVYNWIDSGELEAIDLAEYGVISKLVVLEKENMPSKRTEVNGWRLFVKPERNGLRIDTLDQHGKGTVLYLNGGSVCVSTIGK